MVLFRGIFMLMFLWVLCKPVAAQMPDGSAISLEFNQVTISDALTQISDKYDVNIAYQSNLPELHRKVSHSFSNADLTGVLTFLLDGTGLAYRKIARQLVIYRIVPITPDKILLEANLHVYGTEEPVNYAGIELNKARKGTISDNEGKFRLELDARFSADTLVVSSLNFNPLRIPVSHLLVPGEHTFYLTRRVYNLPDIVVEAEKPHFKQWGNNKWFSSGSFYLDTHGQQTALFIETGENEKIVAVNFYLSRHGNAEAPVRLHVYIPDSVNGKPGFDILPEMVIVKPNIRKGWYQVNISRYNIHIPVSGLFIALEGIFPGEYDFFYNGGSEVQLADDSDNEDEAITYGQQIGYTGGSTNNTWHYSMDGKWFQLKKKHFNAMISVDVVVLHRNKTSKFWFPFRKNKK